MMLLYMLGCLQEQDLLHWEQVTQEGEKSEDKNRNMRGGGSEGDAPLPQGNRRRVMTQLTVFLFLLLFILFFLFSLLFGHAACIAHILVVVFLHVLRLLLSLFTLL